MRTKPVKVDATPDELLALLMKVENDLHRFGGVHRQRARRDMIQAAMDGGCSPRSLADALGVSIGELLAWSRSSSAV